MTDAEIDAFLASDGESDASSSDGEVVFDDAPGTDASALGFETASLKEKKEESKLRRCAAILDVITPLLVIIMVPVLLYATRPTSAWALARHEQLKLFNETMSMRHELNEIRALRGAATGGTRRLAAAVSAASPDVACRAVSAAACPPGTTLALFGDGALASATCAWRSGAGIESWSCPAGCAALGGDGRMRCVEVGPPRVAAL
jgi:hypothetical protein